MLTISPSARSGSLLPPSAAPVAGERVEALLQHGDVVIEQILSGHDATAQAYLQDHDEWVVLLAGAAVIDVGGEQLELKPGDWAFLPARVPHMVLRTMAGTSWLAVHLGQD